MSEELDPNVVKAAGASGIVSDTPRTDALMRPNGCFAADLMDHARQLEREVNHLRAHATGN